MGIETEDALDDVALDAIPVVERCFVEGGGGETIDVAWGGHIGVGGLVNIVGSIACEKFARAARCFGAEVDVFPRIFGGEGADPSSQREPRLEGAVVAESESLSEVGEAN